MTKSLRHLDFVFLCVLSLILWWHSLVSTLGLALRRDEYEYILLILPISAVLICLELISGNAQLEPNFRSGSVLLLLAALLGLVGSGWWGPASRLPDIQLSMSMLALVTWWIGSFVSCFGTRVFRMCVFPLCFLLWLVPFPAFALIRITSFLQQGSASAAHLLLAAAGVPVTQDGIVLSIPELTIEVTRECSSIRSSTLLWVTTMVLAQLLLRSPWHKALTMVTAIPIAVMKNGLRVFAIAMLTTRVDRGFMTGRLHMHGGVVFFMISLVIVLALLWFLRRAEDRLLPAPALRPMQP